jgi:hypothetical protein
MKNKLVNIQEKKELQVGKDTSLKQVNKIRQIRM